MKYGGRMYKILYTKQAKKDAKKLQTSALDKKARKLIEMISKDPFAFPPSYEALVGNLTGAYSRRINVQHRLVYSVDEKKKTIRILRMWTHYE